MGFNWGGAAGGAVQGGMLGAKTGNPYVAAIAAVANGLLGGFSKRDEEGNAKNWAAKGSDLVNMASSFGSQGGGGAGGYASMATSLLGNQGGSKDEEGAAPAGGGFGNYANIALKALQMFGGGQDEAGQEEEDPSFTRAKTVETTPSIPAVPGAMLGFPSLANLNVRNKLQEALARSRGF